MADYKTALDMAERLAKQSGLTYALTRMMGSKDFHVYQHTSLYPGFKSLDFLEVVSPPKHSGSVIKDRQQRVEKRAEAQERADETQCAVYFQKMKGYDYRWALARAGKSKWTAEGADYFEIIQPTPPPGVTQVEIKSPTVTVSVSNWAQTPVPQPPSTFLSWFEEQTESMRLYTASQCASLAALEESVNKIVENTGVSVEQAVQTVLGIMQTGDKPNTLVGKKEPPYIAPPPELKKPAGWEAVMDLIFGSVMPPITFPMTGMVGADVSAISSHTDEIKINGMVMQPAKAEKVSKWLTDQQDAIDYAASAKEHSGTPNFEDTTGALQHPSMPPPMNFSEWFEKSDAPIKEWLLSNPGILYSLEKHVSNEVRKKGVPVDVAASSALELLQSQFGPNTLSGTSKPISIAPASIPAPAMPRRDPFAEVGRKMRLRDDLFATMKEETK